PAGDVAFLVDVPAGEARAHRDAENGLVVQAHGPGERRHIAIVGDFDGHVAPLFGDIEVERLDVLVELIGWHLAEQGCDAGLVVDVDAGRADADGVDAGHVLGGATDRIIDAVEVVLRIAIDLRLPHDFAGENLFAVNDRSRFSIAASGVESDAATFE